LYEYVQAEIDELVHTLRVQQGQVWRLASNMNSRDRLAANMALEATMLGLCAQLKGLSDVMNEWCDKLQADSRDSTKQDTTCASEQASESCLSSWNALQMTTQLPSACAKLQMLHP
jgi:phage host-nuclease inhibitor protein Gam